MKNKCECGGSIISFKNFLSQGDEKAIRKFKHISKALNFPVASSYCKKCHYVYDNNNKKTKLRLYWLSKSRLYYYLERD